MKAMGGGARNGILSLKIQDKSVLYAAYMPFVKNGGLFISTENPTASVMKFSCC